ncbi:hypothetical protein HDU98_000864, partial [Podochytrium sp. JEL0797]
SIWSLFLLFELLRQSIRYLTPYSPPTLPTPAATGMMGTVMSVVNLGIQMSGMAPYVSRVTQLRGVYQSVVDDVSAFVVVLGLVVGMSAWYVEAVKAAGGVEQDL